MIKLFATDEQKEYVKNYLKTRNLGQRGKFDGDFGKQFTGYLAQIIVTDYLKQPRVETEGFDGGFDLVLKDRKIDVKCEIRAVAFKKSYAHNLSAYQVNYGAKEYIFVSFNGKTGEFTICGKITKDDLRAKARLFRKGDLRQRDDGTEMDVKSDYYELNNKDLIDVKSLEDFYK